ncbi:MAG: two pore domain potassium channel family protein, partial [Terriglobales bacterium]
LGLGFIAVIISYLPVLYGGFSNRETSISMLDAHAGSPPSASEWLTRSAGAREQLQQYLADWERWSATLLESHISYPVLGYFRSQHVNQSWLAALTAVLDTCALLIAGTEDGCASQARLTFAMARHSVVDLAQIFIQAVPQDIPERLPAADLASLRARLDAAGLRLRLEPEAVRELEGLRRMYEPHVLAIGAHLKLDVPAWIGDPNASDNWQRSPWDRLGRAQRLPPVGERHF